MSITLLYSALMLLRVAFLLYRPITNKYLNYIVFQSFAYVKLALFRRMRPHSLLPPRYYVPEMAPILMQLYFMRAVRSIASHSARSLGLAAQGRAAASALRGCHSVANVAGQRQARRARASADAAE